MQCDEPQNISPRVKPRGGNPGLKGRLLDKSMEGYILALEIINQLSVKYRVETFAYLMCNAWELLLKAKIIEDAGGRRAIYYPKKRGEDRRSLSLRDCLKRVFPDAKDPIRRNVERVAELRDRSVHLVISRIPKDVIGLFQASVLNYHRCLGDWFGISLCDRVPVGMMTIVYDLDPEGFDVASPIFRRRVGRETADYLARYQAEIREELDELGRSSAFSIEIDYKLALVKKPGDADVVLTSGATGTPVAAVEVPKDPCRTHPYRQKELIEAVRQALPAEVTINRYDMRCILQVYKVRKRPEWYYKGTVPGSPSQYSQAFRDWIVARYANDNTFFDETRRKARAQALSSKRRGASLGRLRHSIEPERSTG